MFNPINNINIIRSIFTAVHLALIAGGLVSCVVQVPQPTNPIEQQKPVVEPNQQPNQANQNEENDDQDDDSNDNKDDKD